MSWSFILEPGPGRHTSGGWLSSTSRARDDVPVRIVSLLPAATEIAFALGIGDQVVGRSFECEYPPAACGIPVVAGTALPTEGALSANQLDAEVEARVAAGESIYTLDAARIRAIDPDLILTQDLCQVCAVPAGAIEEALDVIGCQADVVSLDPGRLDEVISCIGHVGQATGAEREANTLMATLRDRVDAVRSRTGVRPRPAVFVLEWPDPPFNGGHWVPDMIEAAGGTPVLTASGERSRRLTWEKIASEAIDVTIFSPCGFDLEGVVAQAESFIDRPEAAALGTVIAVDANAYFACPGPRVVDGVELLSELLHPTRPGLVPAGASIVRVGSVPLEGA
jgi:iron complex transport system substrate-binding protein